MYSLTGLLIPAEFTGSQSIELRTGLQLVEQKRIISNIIKCKMPKKLHYKYRVKNEIKYVVNLIDMKMKQDK